MALPQKNSSVGKGQPNPGQVRNVKTSLNDDFKYINDSASPYAGQVASNEDLYRAPTNVQYSQQAYKENVLGPVGITNKQSRKAKAANDESYSEEMPDRANDYRERIRQKVRERLAGKALPSSLSLAKNQVARVKATTINVSALSWGMSLWFFVQLPFAVLGIITLGVVAGVESITSGEGGILATIGKWVGQIASALATFVGLDFAEYAMAIFTASYLIAMIVGLGTLLVVYVQYELGGLRPLSGQASGMKMGALALAVMGYCLPFVNVFPFVLLTMATVWLHPR